jgi:general secretion pathway protein A
VFGVDTIPRKRPSRSYAAPLLGGLGLLCVGWALALQLLPNLLPKQGGAIHAAPRSPASAALTQAVPQVLPPVPAASMPASAPTAVPVPLPVPRPIEDLDALLPTAPQDAAWAWRDLGQLWKVDSSPGEPCQAAARLQLQCYRGSDLSIPMLRLLDRPGILELRQASGAAVYAVLVGLDDQTATLRLDGQLHRVNLIALVRLWRGDFATFWQAPVGYRSDLRETVTSTAYGHLANQLSRLEGKPVRPGAVLAQPLDATLVARVKAFQKVLGIRSDGHPGPLTFMQIDKALGAGGPSLDAGSH